MTGVAAQIGTAADLAAELRHIADRMDKLGGQPIHGMFVQLDLQSWSGFNGEHASAASNTVDVLGQALHGRPGSDRTMSDGSIHHEADGRIGAIRVAVYTAVNRTGGDR